MIHWVCEWCGSKNEQADTGSGPWCWCCLHRLVAEEEKDMKRGIRKTVRTRPAEAGGVAFAAASLVGRLLGWPDDVTNAVAVLAGVAPAIITWFRVHVWPKK